MDQEIKNSYIQNLHMKSSMFTLWLITGILSYAHKIPFIGRILTLLSMYYGRTTIWKVLVKLRKAFVAFNAIIGVYMVYKSVGFGFDNILAGFAGMGEMYIQMLYNFSKKLFNWFFELFDYKVVPNIPGDPSLPSKPSRPIIPGNNLPSILDLNFPKDIPRVEKEPWYESLRELYKQPTVNINVNPWYKDLSTWLWIGSIAGTIGICYVGYKIIFDPLFISDDSFFSFLNRFNSRGDGGGGPNLGGAPDIELTSPSSGGSITPIASGSNSSRSLTFLLKSGIRKLNPYYWLSSTVDVEASRNLFMDNQLNVNTYDRRFYPYTEYNPYDPIYLRVKHLIFGESASELNTRMSMKRNILNNMVPIAVGEHLSVPNSPMAGNWGFASNSPILSGLPALSEVFNPASSVVENATTSQLTKLQSLPPSPGSLNPSLPESVIPNWSQHTVNPDEITDYANTVRHARLRTYAESIVDPQLTN